MQRWRERPLPFAGRAATLSPMPPLPIRRLSPPGEQFFFGYYDVPACSPDGKLHLCHRVAFRDRMPRAEDVAEFGVFETANGAFRILGATRAWNFQQGSMLQWLGGRGDRFILNDVSADGRHIATIRDLAGRTVATLEAPVANVSTDGRTAVGVSFSRMFDFRPGYGYAQFPDPHAAERHPEETGVHVIDIATGKARLVLSLAELHRRLRHLSPLLDEKLLINHITLNPSGTRFVALVRNFPVPLPPGMPQDVSQIPGKIWRTTVITADLGGNDMNVLVPASYASHYHWRDDRTIVFHCDGPQGPQLYEIDDSAAPTLRALDTAFFRRDGHCSYSPDRAWMLYDSYPDEAGIQHLYLYHLANRRGAELAAFPSLPVDISDLRCDLHPRWWADGKTISFDSTHEGYRALYVANLESAMAALA